MFMHVVYFWLKPDLKPADKRQFMAKLKAMKKIPSVKFFHVGTPAKTDRPVIDRTYSVALVTGFATAKGQDDYQVHPIHDAFRKDCAHCWMKVVIYDSVE
jgi:hypothetical protein